MTGSSPMPPLGLIDDPIKRLPMGDVSSNGNGRVRVASK
jgi:hypothetical protein